MFRPCQLCARGLTSPAMSTSGSACLAGPGWYTPVINGSAVRCPMGSWKAATGNTTSCNDCAFNLSTMATGSVSPSDCLAVAGYYTPTAGAAPDPCPAGSYKPAAGNANTARLAVQTSRLSAADRPALQTVLPRLVTTHPQQVHHQIRALLVPTSQPLVMPPPARLAGRTSRLSAADRPALQIVLPRLVTTHPQQVQHRIRALLVPTSQPLVMPPPARHAVQTSRLSAADRPALQTVLPRLATTHPQQVQHRIRALLVPTSQPLVMPPPACHAVQTSRLSAADRPALQTVLPRLVTTHPQQVQHLIRALLVPTSQPLVMPPPARLAVQTSRLSAADRPALQSVLPRLVTTHPQQVHHQIRALLVPTSQSQGTLHRVQLVVVFSLQSALVLQVYPCAWQLPDTTHRRQVQQQMLVLLDRTKASLAMLRPAPAVV